MGGKAKGSTAALVVGIVFGLSVVCAAAALAIQARPQRARVSAEIVPLAPGPPPAPPAPIALPPPVEPPPAPAPVARARRRARAAAPVEEAPPEAPLPPPPPTLPERIGSVGSRPPPPPPAAAASGGGRLAELSRRVPIVMYGAQWCGACRQARAWLRQEGVHYVDHDIDREPAARSRLRAIAPSGGIPTFEIDGAVSTGFSASRFRAAVERAARRR